METDAKWMARALELAARARGQTRPNPLVGAVIVSASGEVLGEGWHRRAGEPHAEAEALAAARAAGRDVRGATMYATLEPCNHTGRTGPCTAAIIGAGIARVVAAMRDPNAVARGGVEALRQAGIAVDTGTMEAEARALNPVFIHYHEQKRPHATLKWAMTLDGCTSTATGDSKWITGEAARAEVHRRRAGHDAILAGIGTVLRDDARLSVRGVELPPGPPPMRIVLDSNLRLPPMAEFLRVADGSRAIVACADDADRAREFELRAAGAEVWRLRRGPHGVSLADLIMHLYAEKVQSLYMEGGRTLAGAFLQHEFCDRIEAWIAPRVLGGGGSAVLGPVVRESPLALMGEALRLRDPQVSCFGGDWVIEGELAKG